VKPRQTVAVRRLLAVLPLVALVAACGGNDHDDSPGGAASGASPSTPHKTIKPIQLPPPPPPTGKLVAHIEQASHDAARNRFEVWVDNDTDQTIKPTKVTYQDDRFRTPLPGTRLRKIPSQAVRGFPIYIPEQPACDRTATNGTLTVDYRVDGTSKTTTIPVDDEADIIPRVASAACLDLAVEKIATLSFSDEVTASGDGGQGSVGTITLNIDTTGVAGSTLVIDTIIGNPVLSPGQKGDLGVLKPDLKITGDQPSRTVAVPIVPTRCDLHAFGESGNYNLFTFNVHVDGKPGQFGLRLSLTGSKNALDYAKSSCGFLTSIEGGHS
jgi:hypothetical protein